MKHETYSLEETQALAQNLAKSILEKPSATQGAFVVTLSGELGSGKTTFAQGFAAGLGITEKILSPTFVIVKSYPIPGTEKILYHIDCYRIKDSHDLLELGWQEIVQNPNNIILLEWPERVQDIIPKQARNIQFENIGETQRQITVQS